MNIERYNSNGRFHEAVIVNGIIYLSGQISYNGGSIAEQTKEILDNIAETLKKYNSDKEHMISATVYLNDVNDFSEFNSVWDVWFEEGTQPARTCIGSACAARCSAMEITVIAAQK